VPFLKTLIVLISIMSVNLVGAAEPVQDENFAIPQSPSRHACDAGDENGCVQVLVDTFFEIAKLDGADEANLSQLLKSLTFEKACKNGSPTACAANTLPDFHGLETKYDLADEDASRVKQPLTADQQLRLAIMSEACERDSALACLIIGSFLAENKDPAEAQRGMAFVEKSIALATKLCDENDVRICDIIAALYEDGGPIKDDSAKATDFRLRGHGKECTEPSICFALGQKYAVEKYKQPKGSRRDIGVAAAFFTKACDGGEIRACTNLGMIYAGGYYATGELSFSPAKHAIPPNRVRMEQLLNKACDAGDGLGCLNLAVINYFDKPDYKDDKLDSRSVALFVKACDDPIVRRACSVVGEAYLSGHGVPRDLALAKEYFRKSCADADKACLVEVVKTGRTIPRDIGNLIGQPWH
jgi:TPR repeat protein